MSLTVIHPFGAYQPGDTIPDADAAAILASGNASNVVSTSAPDVEPAADAFDDAPEPVAEPEPEPTPEPELPPELTAPAAVSDFDPS